jgi:hypothetical protein
MSKLMIMVVLVALGGCDAGNYSNEDLDYQLAVPERQDIAIKLPAQAQASDASAEHYRTTRNAVTAVGAIADAFLGLIDQVRSNPPTERLSDRRVWGPFPVKGMPQWMARLVIQRQSEAPLRFQYGVELRAPGAADTAWLSLINGSFAPNGNARRGTGVLHFGAAAARAAGYALGGLAGVETLDIEYQTDAYPLHLRITEVTFPAMNSAVFDHTEQQDGSGALLFAVSGDGPLISDLEIRSRWLGSGAGRADLLVVAGLLMGKQGTDCWGIDTRPTYVHRDWDALLEQGMESRCVFPAP